MKRVYEFCGGRKMFCALLGVVVAIALAVVYAVLGEPPDYLIVIGAVYGALGLSIAGVAYEDAARHRNGK